jgi:hypothetical protein
MRGAATGASGDPFPLTMDSLPADSRNCLNNYDGGTGKNVQFRLIASDITNAANQIAYVEPAGLLYETGNSTTIAYQPSGMALTNAVGTTAGWGITFTLNTTYGCVVPGFTRPTGNTDTWYLVISLNWAEPRP